MPRIGLVVTSLNPSRTGGAETYIRCLLTSDAFREATHQHELVLFHGHPVDPAIHASGFPLVACPVATDAGPSRILQEQSRLPSILRAAELDLVHLPYSIPLRNYRKTCVITVHDSLHLRPIPNTPVRVSPAERLLRWLTQGRIARDGHHVIAVSATDGRILRAGLGISGEKLHVVPHGYPLKFDLGGPTTVPRQPELLWLGRPYPHKNLSTLMSAVGVLAREGWLGPKISLIGIGAGDAERVKRLLRETGAEALVEVQNAVPHEALPRRVHAARGLVLPSRYESFGLPAIEALVAGTPLLCNDLPVFRELFGEHPMYCPHDTAQGWSDALRSFTSVQPNLEALRAAYEHAKTYTWNLAARRTAEVYQCVLGEANGSD